MVSVKTIFLDIQYILRFKFLFAIFVIIYLASFAPLRLNAQESVQSIPLKLGVSNIIDISSNVRGGLRQDTAVLYNLDLTAELDTSYFGLSDGTLFLYGIVNNAKELNPIVGDFQVSSNIDNGEVFRLYEFWYEQAFGDGEGSLKFGLYDLNSEFDAIEPAGLFLNSSHGIGAEFAQAGENGPSIFPSTSLAARLQYRINDRLILRAAILDAVPNDPEHPKRHKISLNEGALLVGEAETALTEAWRAVVGVWRYTSKFDPIDESRFTQIGGNTGAYAFAEGALNDRTSVWFRLGVANQDINQLSHYIGAGIVYKGLFPFRPEDNIGFAVAAAGNGSTFKDISAQSFTPVDGYEISYELTYRMELTPWLNLQPDVQYIRNPGMNPGVKDALVIGVRIELAREF